MHLKVAVTHCFEGGYRVALQVGGAVSQSLAVIDTELSALRERGIFPLKYIVELRCFVFGEGLGC